jgi:hypothetical protein
MMFKTFFHNSARVLGTGLLALLFLTLTAGVSLAQCFQVGDPATVEWSGSWYPAKVQKVDGTKFFIRYDGYGSEWDEWVSGARIKQVTGYNYSCWGVGDVVSVEWKGSWYPAKILKAEGGRYLISYDGYGSEWDEWVTPARMRNK